MQKLCFVTCQDYPDICDADRAFVDLIAEQIGAQNIYAHPWDNPDVDWDEFDILILLYCWGYHADIDNFSTWLSQISNLDLTILNPPDLIHWNMHKSYLKDIEKWGVATLPTIFTDPETFQVSHLDQVFEALNTDRIIVKPCISAGSENTFLLQKDDPLKATINLCQNRDMMLQAYSPDLVAQGEISLFYFGGKYSHGIIKKPKDGDFRSQPSFGSEITAFDPTPPMQEIADILISQKKPTYARIDGVDINGVFHIVEFELIEPSLFMVYAKPDSAQKMADALLYMI